MTISSSTRKAGPFAGDGASMIFAFAFKVFSDSDLYVVRAVASTGAETVLTLTTDYTVTLNADQNNNPGGTVTLLSALASGYTLTLTSSLGYLQPTDLTNQGGFYPQVITTALDRLTILAQQLKEKLDRAAVVPISSTLTVDALTADLITLADDVANIDTVAGISADVSTVAGVSTDVTTAAANITDISNFADIYYGPSATAPTTRKDGSALQEGDLYFDTATNLMRVRTAVSGWRDAQTPVPVTITTQTFSGTGSQTAFTLSSAPAFLNALDVHISGINQVPGVDYTLSETSLSFTTAPPLGTGNILCRWISPYAGGVPNDGSVTTPKLADGAVTAAKLSTGHPTWDTGGTLSATAFSGPLTGAYQGGFRRELKVRTTGYDKHVYVTAGQLLVTASSGLAVVLNNVSFGTDSTIVGANGLDTGTLAASTWYSVWVIHNPTTASTFGLLSLSATAPTLPSGYIYSTRVGWIRTDATANKYPLGILQVGNRVQYLLASSGNTAALPRMATGAAGSTTAPTWSSISTSTFVPTTAGAITVFLHGTGSDNAVVAPNNVYGSRTSTTIPTPSKPSGTNGCLIATFNLESSNIYYASDNSTTALMCLGWEDNL